MSGKYEGGDTPDSITPVVGIRGWRVSQTLRNHDRLFSVYKPGVSWPVGRKVTAQCIQPSAVLGKWIAHTMPIQGKLDDPIKSLPVHDAPYEDCTCGIYALNSSLVSGEVRPWQSNALVGVVLMWGRVLEGTRGWRGQYAKVVSLWMDSEEPERANLISQMAEMYHVPVILDLDAEVGEQRIRQGGAA